MGSRWLTPIGVLVVALVVLASATGNVGVGTSGPASIVAALLVAYATAGLMLLLARPRGAAADAALLVCLGGAAVGLHAVDPAGPVVGLFLVAAFAPLRLPVRSAAAIAGAATAAFNVTQFALNDRPLVFALVTAGGSAFFFLFGLLLRRESEQREQLDAALTALEVSRAAEAAAAAVAERGRIAREMHDVLAHTLSGLRLQLGGALLLARDRAVDREVVDQIERAHHLAAAGIDEARRALKALRGEALPGPEGIPALVDDHRRAGGSVEFRVRGEPSTLDPEARLTLYRAVQESLSNVRKHAPDATALVSLTWTPDTVALVVENACPPGDSGPPGHGLLGLAERAQLAGGTLAWAGLDGRFRLSLTLPIQEDAR